MFNSSYKNVSSIVKPSQGFISNCTDVFYGDQSVSPAPNTNKPVWHHWARPAPKPDHLHCATYCSTEVIQLIVKYFTRQIKHQVWINSWLFPFRLCAGISQSTRVGYQTAGNYWSNLRFCKNGLLSYSDWCSRSSPLISRSALVAPKLCADQRSASRVETWNFSRCAGLKTCQFWPMRRDEALCRMQKWHQPAFCQTASRGQLHWFQKEVWFYVSLWENDPNSHLIITSENSFMVSIVSFKLSLTRHDVYFVNYGPV